MRGWLPLFTFIGALITLLMVGRLLADYFGIELTLDSVHEFRDWIDSIGWWGPLAYVVLVVIRLFLGCLLYTSPSPRDVEESRMPSSA